MTGYRGSPGASGMNLQNAAGNSPSYVTNMPVGQPKLWRAAGNMPGQQYGVPGRPVQSVSGNPDVATSPAVPPPKQPGNAYTPPGKVSVLNVGQESSWRGGANFANDKLMTSDRHGILKTGTELSGRDSGFTDPPLDGPARPSLFLLQRTINWQQGNPLANQDDLTRNYSRNAQGMYIGEQGTGWSPVYGGVPGLWQPYGSYAGYTTGPVKGIQSPVAYLSQSDGPHKVFSGPPHGLHTETLPDYSQTLGYYMATPGMRPPRIDRPANSPIAGQSYSQTVVPQGQTGTAAQQGKQGAAGAVKGPSGAKIGYSPSTGWRGN